MRGPARWKAGPLRSGERETQDGGVEPPYLGSEEEPKRTQEPTCNSGVWGTHDQRL
jgi:hypothetical protein